MTTTDKAGTALVLLLILSVAGVLFRGHARSEWAECRTLLTTQDSTAVLAARPACAQWTWPPKEGTQ